MKNLIMFTVWLIFLFVEGGGFVVQLVAAQTIRQHMFFFTLSYFVDNNL